MVIKNERVASILEIVEQFKACDVTHIARLYYSGNSQPIKKAQAKLTAMIEYGLLKRKRNNINCRYYYYLDREPTQLQHKLLLTELYIQLCEKYGQKNIEFVPEYSAVPGIRPDAFIKVQYNRRTYLYFAEIQISNTPLDLLKYERAYIATRQSRIFPEGVFPSVLAVTDKIVPAGSRHLNIITIDTGFNNLNRLVS
ncbi:MAG: hypothetical protein FIA99_05535 [Ruminiclostridium sp.]|nr:hypothetical protein [Ruminiclostridium sp.]